MGRKTEFQMTKDTKHAVATLVDEIPNASRLAASAHQRAAMADRLMELKKTLDANFLEEEAALSEITRLSGINQSGRLGPQAKKEGEAFVQLMSELLADIPDTDIPGDQKARWMKAFDAAHSRHAHEGRMNKLRDGHYKTYKSWKETLDKNREAERQVRETIIEDRDHLLTDDQKLYVELASADLYPKRDDRVTELILHADEHKSPEYYRARSKREWAAARRKVGHWRSEFIGNLPIDPADQSKFTIAQAATLDLEALNAEQRELIRQAVIDGLNMEPVIMKGHGREVMAVPNTDPIEVTEVLNRTMRQSLGYSMKFKLDNSASFTR